MEFRAHIRFAQTEIFQGQDRRDLALPEPEWIQVRYLVPTLAVHLYQTGHCRLLDPCPGGYTLPRPAFRSLLRQPALHRSPCDLGPGILDKVSEIGSPDVTHTAWIPKKLFVAMFHERRVATEKWRGVVAIFQ
jgi:hypothetical protein